MFFSKQKCPPEQLPKNNVGADTAAAFASIFVVLRIERWRYGILILIKEKVSLGENMYS